MGIVSSASPCRSPTPSSSCCPAPPCPLQMSSQSRLYLSVCVISRMTAWSGLSWMAMRCGKTRRLLLRLLKLSRMFFHPPASHFVLSAHEVLEDICPMEAAVNTNEEYTCRGGGHDLEVMAGAMHNWHRAVCARETDPEWEGEFDPAYQPQQVALTAGFMCIIACDCNEAMLPGTSLAYFAETPETANVLHDLVCSSIPWGSIEFADGSSDVEVLADLSAPLMEVCGCAA